MNNDQTINLAAFERLNKRRDKLSKALCTVKTVSLTAKQRRVLSCVHFSCRDPFVEPETCTCDNYAAGMPDRRCRVFYPTKEEVKNGEDCCPFRGIYGFHTAEGGTK